MANYKIAIQMHQDSSGSDNALARISFNGSVIADNLEVTSTSHETPNLFVYDVTSDDTPAADAWQTIKVELLNDNYVDADDDRNLCLHRIGYLYQDPDTNNYIAEQYYTPDTADPPGYPTRTPASNITDFTDIANFNTIFNWKYTSTEDNELNDLTAGTTYEGGQITQTITFAFAEYEIAFDRAEKMRGKGVANEYLSYSTFGDNPPNLSNLEEDGG